MPEESTEHQKFCYLLIQTAPAKEHDVYESLMSGKIKTNDIKASDVVPLFGEYDLIVKVAASNHDALKEYELAVREMPGVIGVKVLDGIKF